MTITYGPCLNAHPLIIVTAYQHDCSSRSGLLFRENCTGSDWGGDRSRLCASIPPRVLRTSHEYSQRIEVRYRLHLLEFGISHASAQCSGCQGR